MSWLVGIFIYFLIWWTALFIILPIGVERDETPEKGHSSGAPKNAKIGQKIAYTTLLATVLWVLLYLLSETGMIDYRAIVSFE